MNFQTTLQYRSTCLLDAIKKGHMRPRELKTQLYLQLAQARDARKAMNAHAPYKGFAIDARFSDARRRFNDAMLSAAIYRTAIQRFITINY